MARKDAVPPFLSAKIAVESRNALVNAVEDAIRTALAEGCGNEEVSMALEDIAERHGANLTMDAEQTDTVGTVH
jgi:uncharacterized ferredoxin-like protein